MLPSTSVSSPSSSQAKAPNGDIEVVTDEFSCSRRRWERMVIPIPPTHHVRKCSYQIDNLPRMDLSQLLDSALNRGYS